MVAIYETRVDDDDEAIMEHGGSFARVVTADCPRTCPGAVAQTVHTFHDTNGDSEPDHAARNRIGFIDLDGNGVIEPGKDLVCVHTEHVAVIQDGVCFDFGRQWARAAAERVFQMLGGRRV